MRKRKKKGKRDSSRLLKMLLFFVLSGCVFTVLLSLALPRGAPSLTNAQDSNSKSNLYNRSPEVSFTVDDTTGMLDRRQKQLLEEYAEIYAGTPAALTWQKGQTGRWNSLLLTQKKTCQTCPSSDREVHRCRG